MEKENLPVILYVGQDCNNDCMMCSVEGVHLNHTHSYSKLVKKLRDQRNDKDSVELTGGEPTEHDDVIKLIKKAKELGYKDIRMSSNGINFSDKDFTKKITEAGLTEINIALHGPKKIHDKITQNQGAFDKVLKGVKNLQSEDVDITVDSVVMSLNINHLKNLHERLFSIGIRKVGFVDLVPDGKGHRNLDKLITDYKEKKIFFYDILGLLEKFFLVHTANFPRCVLPVKLPDNLVHTSHFQKEKEWNFEGGPENSDNKKRKIKLSFCQKCRHFDHCFGFREEKIEMLGKENIKEMLDYDNYLEVES